MIKMSSVLDLMELKVEVIKIFLPLLVSLLNEYSILLITPKQTFTAALITGHRKVIPDVCLSHVASLCHICIFFFLWVYAI